MIYLNAGLPNDSSTVLPLLSDVTGKCQEWLDCYQPLEHLAVFCEESIAARSSRYGTRGGNTWGAGLPIPSYTKPPKPKINQLYWPTGARRWATFYGLIKGKQLAIYQNEIFARTSTIRFLDEKTNQGISFVMYPLTPRPITGFDAGDDTVYLLPMVDSRYFWQYQQLGNLQLVSPDFDPVSATASTKGWKNFLDGINGEGDNAILFLGQLSYSTIPNEYTSFIPDGIEFNRQSNSMPIMLDAIANSIGMRVVQPYAPPTGSTSSKTFLQNSSDASQAIARNQSLSTQVAGGNFNLHASHLPQTVYINFPKLIEFHPDEQGNNFIITLDGNQLNLIPSNIIPLRASKNIYCSAFLRTDQSSTNFNESLLRSLALQIAKDYYSWLDKAYDLTFSSLVPWEMNGYDDFAMWTFDHKDDNDNLYCTTRIVSMPPDFGVEQNLNQDLDNYPYYGDNVWGYLAGGAIFPIDNQNGSKMRNKINISTDPLENVDDPVLASNTRVAVVWDHQRQQWMIENANCVPEDSDNIPADPS